MKHRKRLETCGRHCQPSIQTRHRCTSAWHDGAPCREEMLLPAGSAMRMPTRFPPQDLPQCCGFCKDAFKQSTTKKHSVRRVTSLRPRNRIPDIGSQNLERTESHPSFPSLHSTIVLESNVSPSDQEIAASAHIFT